VKHTKGPWRVAKVDGKKLTCVYTDRTNIALLVHQEDANLIASAPELLEILNNLLNDLPFGIEEAYEITTWHKSGGSGTMGNNSTKKLIKSIKEAKQAIAKAGGV